MNLLIHHKTSKNVLTDAEMKVLIKLVKQRQLNDEEKKIQQRIIKFLTPNESKKPATNKLM